MRMNPTGEEGVIFNVGKKWQEQRRFMLSTLRDFGFGKSSMEQLISEEIDRFLAYIETKATKGPLVMKVRNYYIYFICKLLSSFYLGNV